MVPVPPGCFRFRSSDPDEFMEQIAPVASGVSVSAAGHRTFQASVRATRLDRIGMFSILSAGFRVRSPVGRPFVSINVPVRGCAVIRHGAAVRVRTPGSCSVIEPEARFEFVSDEPSDWLVVNVDQSLVREDASRFDDRDVSVLTGGELSFAHPAGASLHRYLRTTWAEIEAAAPWLGDDRVVAEVERMLTTHLLFAIEAERRDPTGPVKESGADAVRRAIDFMMAHLDQPLSITDLAAESGSTVRSLQRGFRRLHGVTPLHYLRDRRLDAARHALRTSDARIDSVTSTAYRYGFAHLGRFAGAYRARFGESPAETLRASAPS